tara:strand:- start:197 stop:1471 length:1275 start_codon:yes stop_codon:yes gene_type:complete
MAFNLMAFAGGAARGLSERLDDEERKYEKLQDEARTRAEQQRLSRKASRERKKLLAEESINSLVFMGYSAKQAADITSKGKMAVSESVRYAGIARDRGQDISTFYNIAGTPEAVGQTLNVSDVAGISTGTPPISGAGITTGTPPVSGGTAGTAGSAVQQTRSALGFDNTRLSSLLKPELEDKIQSSLDSAYAVAVQKEMRATDPEEIAKHKADATAILERMKATEDEKDTGRLFSEGTITAAVKTARMEAHKAQDFNVGKEGEIIGGISGKIAEYNTAELTAARSLYALNMNPATKQPQDMMMHNTVVQMTQSATSKISQYGRRIANGNFNTLEHLKIKGATVNQVTTEGGASTYQIESYAPLPATDLMSNARQGQYKVGDVVIVQDQTSDGTTGMRIKIYTGLEQYSKKHDMFIDGGSLRLSQ